MVKYGSYNKLYDSESEDEAPSCFDGMPLMKFTGCYYTSLGLLNQIVSTCICCLTCFSMGLSFGWSSAALHEFKNNETSITLSETQQSYVVSALNIGIMLGAIPTSFLMDTVGRKTTLLYASALGLAHWILVAAAMNASMLYVGRFLGGLFNGIATATVPVYLSENLEPHIRGTIGSLFSILLYGGILCSFILAPIIPYMELSIFSALFTVAFIVMFPFMPETPHYYTMHNQLEQARKSLLWLRGHANVDAELKIIKNYVEMEKQRKGRWTDVFLNADCRRPFMVSLVLSFIQKFTGFFTVISYQSIILPSKIGTLSAEQAAIVIGVVLFASGILSAIFMDRVGRVPLLYISCLGVVASIIPIGLWNYFNNIDDVATADNHNFIPFLGFIFFIIFHAFGLGPVGNIYPSEVLPLSVKAQAMGLVASFAALFSALNTEIFQILNEYKLMWTNYFTFALVAILGMLYINLYVIETKGKTLQAIEEEFVQDAKRPRMRGDYFVL